MNQFYDFMVLIVYQFHQSAAYNFYNMPLINVVVTHSTDHFLGN